MRVFDDFSGHQVDLILSGTASRNDGVPLVLLLGADSFVLLLSLVVELLDG